MMVKFNTHSNEWAYIHGHLSELRESYVNELVRCGDPEKSSRTKGRIQLIDELLELPTYIAGENSLKGLGE